MRKTLLYFPLLVMIFLVGCTSSEEKSQEEIWFWADADNALRGDIFATWTNYVQVLDHTLEAKSPEDYSYIVGRIDGPLEWSEIARVRTLSNISQEVIDTMVAPELQQPLYTLIDNIEMHLESIKYSIEDKKLNDLHLHDEQMRDIIKAVHELNNLSSNYLNDPKESVTTLGIVQNCNMLIEELLSQLQPPEKH